MDPRDTEHAMLERCALVARSENAVAADAREANVFRLAGMVVRSQFPAPSARLRDAGERYFVTHPDEMLSAAQVLKNNWIVGLPRLRDMLSHRLTK